MSKSLTSTATACRYYNVYNGNGSWYTGGSTVDIYNNTSYAQKNIAQWTMNPTGLGAGSIEKITLYIEGYAVNSSDANLIVGCSSERSDYASVTSPGVKITLSAGNGVKVIDVSGLKSYITEFKSTWYLLIGFPDTVNGSIAVAGTKNMLYLEIEYSDGSKIYLASTGTLIPYTLYRAENGSLVPYNIYRAENGSLVKY